MKNRIIFSIVIAALLIGGSSLYTNNHPSLENLRIMKVYLWQRLEDLNIMKVYQDPIHDFRISYPGYLTPEVYKNSYLDGVGFNTGPNDMGVMGVTVSTTIASSAREWVEKKNKEIDPEFPDHRYELRIDKEITINDIPALVVHGYSEWPGGSEEYAYEKSVLLVRNGKLFRLNASRARDEEKIWNSFRFEE